MKLTQTLISEILTISDKLPKFTSLGCYTLAYYTANSDTLCADCALESLMVDKDGDAHDDPAVWVEAYYEGPTVHCDDCGTDIESAYGDPAADSEDES